MAGDSKSLTRAELDELLTSLDLVMQDAEELRRAITQQLADNRANDQQKVSPVSNRRRRPRTRGN
jgi:hypothetical protein